MRSNSRTCENICASRAASDDVCLAHAAVRSSLCGGGGQAFDFVAGDIPDDECSIASSAATARAMYAASSRDDASAAVDARDALRPLWSNCAMSSASTDGIRGTGGGIRGERWKRRGVAGSDVEERWGDGVGVRAREDVLALYLRVYRAVRTSVSTPVARVSGRVEKGGRGCESGKI